MPTTSLPPLHREAAEPPSTTLRLRRSAPGRAATEVARSALRSYGRLTAGRRSVPDLIVVGAKRGGTTSLWRYLAEHPGTLPMFPRIENLKGIYYFADEWHRGDRWYRSHFASEHARRRAEAELGYRPATFEASPYYLFHPLAPQRAKQTAPDATIVAVLRDPVERTYSHWKERRDHQEDLDFEAALAAEADRTAGEEARILADPSYVSAAHRHQTYVAQSRYAPMLERWFEAYGRDRVVVVPAEEFYADPQALVDELSRRLGLPLHRLTDAAPFNARPSKGMADTTRAALREQLTPDIEATAALLGRTLPWPTA